MEQNKVVGSEFNKDNIEYIEILNKAGEAPRGVVIWLHGLGADCNDFVPLVPELKIKESLKFIFPNAPFREITVSNGNVMRGWYDIRDMNKLGNAVDKVGIKESVGQISKLIQSIIASGVKSEDIILAGFSQGGVIAYEVALQIQHRLCGMMVLSSYFADINLIDDTCINKKTPILACHGKQDMIIPYAVGLESYNKLRLRGFNISWMNYNMDHGLCMEEIKDISLWLQDRFI